MIQVVPQKSSLAESLRERIAREGPITFRDWMQTALYDPVDGYYRKNNRKIWGREGDYRTSSERSELFAATFARYFAKLYQQLGSPDRFTIVEVGGGEGHFAAGVLNTLRAYFPKVLVATRYVFDEIGEPARMIAGERLSGFGDRVKFASLNDTPVESGIIFSNEFLDALPVHRVTVIDGVLGEYYVDINSSGEFVWTVGAPSTPNLSSYLNTNGVELDEGQIAEVNLEADVWLTKAARQLKRGYLITVDYGAQAPELYSPERKQGTLRSFHQHTFVENLLDSPGEHDLTSSVSWSALKATGEKVGLRTVQFARQDKFLLEQGLLERLQMESETISEAERIRLSTAAREMILPDRMAASFQVLVQEKLSEA